MLETELLTNISETYAAVSNEPKTHKDKNGMDVSLKSVDVLATQDGDPPLAGVETIMYYVVGNGKGEEKAFLSNAVKADLINAIRTTVENKKGGVVPIEP